MDRQSSSKCSKAKNYIRLREARSNKFFFCIFLLCFGLLLATGCDKYSRYKVLTFFFTGVPHPDREIATIDEESGLSPEELLKKMREDITIVAYAHGPYAAQQCYQCHSTGSSATFRSFSSGGGKSSGAPASQNVSSRLVLPIKELCIDCHTGKSVNAAFNRGLWVHGPVSEGICIACHGPHASPHPYMLHKGSSREMCSSCHTAGFIIMTEDHKKDEECTSCHNPHVGKNRFLLKKDFDENSLR